MWMWKRRERFSLEELKFLTEQLQRTTYVNDNNKDSVVEVLRSIAELMIWGDERDPLFFEYFMEKQVMGLFSRILELSNTTTAVAVQLLQSVSIMVQNLRTEHAIYYIFSNGYLNNFITFPFDFRDEELLAYYISFLRTTSTKLDQTTVSFFIETENNEVVSFPLYTEGIKFFRHEESMVRIAVRTLTLNVYHVNDTSVREFVTSTRAVGYISDVVKFLTDKSSALHDLVTSAESMPESTKCIARLEGRVAETEEILDYCNDIISAGIPDLARAMTESLMQHFVLPLLCSLASGSALCALYLLSRVLYTIKHKPLANGIAAALVCEKLLPTGPVDSARENGVATSCPMELLLSQMVSDNDKVIVATVTFLLSLLHNEVEESILDVLGLLPRLKQHRRHLLQTLMGNNSDEDLLFSSSPHGPGDDGFDAHTFLVEGASGCNEAGVDCKTEYDTKSKSFIRMQEPVIKRLLELICKRPPPSVEALWRCGALLWQIFPYHQDDTIHSLRLEMMHNACQQAKETLLRELDDCWCDVIPFVLSEVWRTSKKALEASQYREQATLLLIPSSPKEESFSSVAVAARMQSAVQVFVALYQIEQLLLGKTVPESPPLDSSLSPSPAVKPGTQLNLSSENAFPCRVAFEKGVERAMYLIPVVKGRLGSVILADKTTARPSHATARIFAPLAGCMPEVDERHPKWLHLRIRPPDLPSSERRVKFGSRSSSPRRIDGTWTLAFEDTERCELAKQAVLKEMRALKENVQQVLQPLLGD